MRVSECGVVRCGEGRTLPSHSRSCIFIAQGRKTPRIEITHQSWRWQTLNTAQLSHEPRSLSRVAGPRPGQSGDPQRGWQTRERGARGEAVSWLAPAPALALAPPQTLALAHRLLQLPVHVSSHRPVQGRKRLDAAAASQWSQ